jgi:hypothetical protein
LQTYGHLLAITEEKLFWLAFVFWHVYVFDGLFPLKISLTKNSNDVTAAETVTSCVR